MSLQVFWTQAGQAAIWSKSGAGLAAEFAQISLGRDFYAPAVNDDGFATQTALKDEIARVNIASAEAISDTQRRIGFVVDDDSLGTVDIGEIGVHLADGTLAMIWSSADHPLFRKSPGIKYAEVIEIVLAGMPADAINIVVDTNSQWGLLRLEELATLAAAQITLQREFLDLKIKLIDQGALE